jgi:hypothetical protein
MEIQTQKVRIILAIEAIRMSKKLNRWSAAKIYKVPESIFRLRINSYIFFHERRLASHKLTDLKEEVIL